MSAGRAGKAVHNKEHSERSLRLGKRATTASISDDGTGRAERDSERSEVVKISSRDRHNNGVLPSVSARNDVIDDSEPRAVRIEAQSVKSG